MYVDCKNKLLEINIDINIIIMRKIKRVLECQ